jgi:hypothetical protein
MGDYKQLPAFAVYLQILREPNLLIYDYLGTKWMNRKEILKGKEMNKAKTE